MAVDKNRSKRQLTDAFYHRLVNSYSYSPDQMEFDVNIASSSTADIAIWRSAEEKQQGHTPNIYVLVTCKAEHIRIKAEDYFERFKQAALSDMAFYVAHNLKETKVFYIDRNARPLKIERIGDFPTAFDIVSNHNLSLFVNRVRGYSKDKFLKTLSRCHNIIRNIDKLSPEAAFDEISKILFIKMLYERDTKDELVYSKDKFLKDEYIYDGGEDYIQFLFNEVKKTYSADGLFDSEDKIRIRRESFLLILEELSSIELYDTSDDLKGIAFELFLGKTFRGELGQFFTPRTIVNYMVEVLDINEGEKVCDPCCGSGGFLIKAFEYIQNQIDQDIHKQIAILREDTTLSEPERQYKISHLLNECNNTIKGSRYHKLCHDYFFGVDANARMARTSKMNMIMHGDGHIGVYLHDGLLDVGSIKEGLFDVILINPPFGAHVDRVTQVDGNRTIDELYELKGSNAELLFIERTIRLLKPGGRAGLVLPEGIFNNNNSATRRLREYVERHAHILNITSIPADVFLASGANIKPSIIFIRKLTTKEKKSIKKHERGVICACKVTDAGINSQGLPSDNHQLQELAPMVREWIKNDIVPKSSMVRMINQDDMEDWNVQPFFNMTPVKFKDDVPLAKLSDVLTQSHKQIILEDDVLYSRITVKLFNKGITLRDQAYGREIGTKKQNRVRAGQLVVSKIDGKSGAFAFLPEQLDGAIVTQDFPVFDIDTKKILPQYMEIVLSYPAMLEQIKATCSGSTGRKRLSIAKFLNTYIPLPSLLEQERQIEKLVDLRRERELLEQEIQEEVDKINNAIFR